MTQSRVTVLFALSIRLREAILIRTRTFAGLLATVATVAALMVPVSASAKTISLTPTPLDGLICGLVGTGGGSLLGGVLVALNIKICQ